MEQSDGRARVIIEGVKPEIDSGRFPANSVVGEKVVVEADVFADGHAITPTLGTVLVCLGFNGLPEFIPRHR